WGRTDDVAPLNYLSDGLRELLCQQQMTSGNHLHTGDSSPYEYLGDGRVDLGEGETYDYIDGSTPRFISQEEMCFLKERLLSEQEMVARGGGVDTRARASHGGDEHQRAMISIEAFVRFSKWWARVMATLSRLRDDWSSTDFVRVRGFVGKQTAIDMLLDKEIGTFLLRFSETEAGALAISLAEQ
ncbi:unnamed protein product, partial [Laminaria digitata]